MTRKTKRKLLENGEERGKNVAVDDEHDISDVEEDENLLNTMNEDDDDTTDASGQSDLDEEEGELGDSDIDEEESDDESSDVDEEESDDDEDESDESEIDEESNVEANSQDNKQKNGGDEEESDESDIEKKYMIPEKKQSDAVPITNGADGKEVDEYASDSSDEEDIRNTVGNIPMNWYDEYKHLGYDWDGKQLIKPTQGDQLDLFLKRMEDPNFWRTVKDPQTGQNVILSADDINLIKRIQGNKIPDETFDEYAPWVEWFTSEVMKMPLRKFPEHKRSFLPSKSEARKVSKLVHALKMGWIKTQAERDQLNVKKAPQFYMLWSTDDQPEEMRRIHKHIPAPKRHLPGHAESYNPPSEYLFDDKEMRDWKKQAEAPRKRKLHFVPQKFDCLRNVPSYNRYVKERFLRCLDLYLCPRAIKMRLTIEPEALIPKLPSPRDLQPFPTTLAVTYEGHTDMVRTITCDKLGEYLCSGSDDGTVKIWEVNTGRCIKTIAVEGVVRSVEWCPSQAVNLILIAANNRVLLINPNVGDFVVCEKTDALIKEGEPKHSDVITSERLKASVQWSAPSDDEFRHGVRLILTHFKEVAHVTWHGRGDYFATVVPQGANRSVLINQLSKRRSQFPFTKSKGLVQHVLFHPSKPLLFVATQKHIRIYDLMKQNMVKKLTTNAKWISRMAVHPQGDNLLVGTYDRKVLWFDLDLSTKPYQTLRLHGTAVRGVAYHKRYPLFASGSDNGDMVVSHGMVYNDLLQNPLLVPLKRLDDHGKCNDFGLFDVEFHPLQPWVFSSGADCKIRLYSN